MSDLTVTAAVPGDPREESAEPGRPAAPLPAERWGTRTAPGARAARPRGPR
ncbi:hypothetical protein [Streptomyces sp. NPDC001985]|uniref:hypothetical protein n=1 Tax=Streptomyces sp. NPDC001985 TaxID=3154406 RepID=UPI00333061E8